MVTAKPTNIPEYIALLPESVRPIAQSIRQVIREAAPESVEDLKYGIPTFMMAGRPVLYFGIWKRHVGLYPVYRGTNAFEVLIGPYRATKDTIRFPLGKPVPLDLIAHIVESQLALRAEQGR